MAPVIRPRVLHKVGICLCQIYIYEGTLTSLVHKSYIPFTFKIDQKGIIRSFPPQICHYMHIHSTTCSPAQKPPPHSSAIFTLPPTKPLLFLPVRPLPNQLSFNALARFSIFPCASSQHGTVDGLAHLEDRMVGTHVWMHLCMWTVTNFLNWYWYHLQRVPDIFRLPHSVFQRLLGCSPPVARSFCRCGLGAKGGAFAGNAFSSFPILPR